MKITRTLPILFFALLAPAVAQVFDNSGNSMLNGKYYFREVFFTSTDAVAIYGNITFSSGTYTVSGTQAFDCNQNGCSQPSNYSTSGTYSISASGYGFISNQLLNSPSYGSVGANGVFVGSVTESGDNDLFIAAPVTSQSGSTLQGTYTLAYIDPLGASTQGQGFDAQLQMSPNGSGGIGNVNVSAYANSSTATTQTISGVKYIVSNNAFVVQFPTSNNSSALIQGNEYLYSTPDGSFVFGGSPQNFDMIVGVRTGGSASGLGGGLYYQAGMDLDNSSGNFDTFYGALNANAGVIIGQERIQYGSGTGQDYTYSDTYTQGSNSYTDMGTSTQYTIGPGGVRIGLGLGPFIGISAAVPAPSLTGSGVFLNPAGVVNSASSAPFTAGISRGEFITLVGTNIGPSQLQIASTVPLPTTLGGVQVLINNVPAPIYYVSSTQLSVVVPWELSTPIALIQVVYNGAPSNTVTEFVNTTTPGVFTVPSGGIGYAAAQHTSDFSLVSPSNPAQIGETIAVYVSGLGDVSPGVADGAAGIFSNTTNTILAEIGGISATVSYSGLAPGLVGLYQLNIQIPSGVTAGDNTLSILNKDGSSFTVEALIPVGNGTPPAATVAAVPRKSAARPAYARPFHAPAPLARRSSALQ